jgi:hypothetical protein
MFIPNFFCRQGGLGGPHGWGGPPSAEISRHQPKPAEISHHQPQGGGGGPFQLENRWPRGVGANFLGVGPIGPPPLPFSLKIVGPGANFLGPMGGAPRGESPIALVVSTHMVWDLGIRELSTNKLERGLSLKGIFGKDF